MLDLHRDVPEDERNAALSKLSYLAIVIANPK